MNPIDRDYTAFKICERTCKRDAYQSALSWAKSKVTVADIIYYLELKVEGHTKFLEEIKMEYEYTTQNIIHTGSEPESK